MKFIFLTGPAGAGKSTIIINILKTVDYTEKDFLIKTKNATIIGQYATRTFQGIDKLKIVRCGSKRIAELLKKAWLLDSENVILETHDLTKNMVEVLNNLQKIKHRKMVLLILKPTFKICWERYKSRCSRIASFNNFQKNFYLHEKAIRHLKNYNIKIDYSINNETEKIISYLKNSV